MKSHHVLFRLSIALILVLLAACGPGEAAEESVQTPVPEVAPTPTAFVPETLFAAEFSSQPDGFAFRNYGIGYPEGDLTIAEVRDLFGDQVCAYFEGERCVPTPMAQMWIDTMNDYMAYGHCAGFTVLGYRFYSGQMAPSTYQPEAAAAFDLPQNAPVMRSIAQNYVYQALEEVWRQTVEGAPREIIDELLDLQQPVDLGIFTDDGSGHSMIAHGVEQVSEDVYHILVYDSNWPGVDTYVEVDYAANTWRYSMNGLEPSADPDAWSGDARSNSLIYIPLSAYDQPVKCPFCKTSGTGSLLSGKVASPAQQDSPVLTYFAVNKPVRVQITNTAGQRLGYFDGQFINEIPGARAIYLVGGLPHDTLVGYLPHDTLPYYGLPTGMDFTANVLLGADQSDSLSGVNVRAIGPGVAYAVDNLAFQPGQTDTMSFSFNPDNRSISYMAGGEQHPALTMSYQQDSMYLLHSIGGFDFQTGQSLYFGIDNTGLSTIYGQGLQDDQFSMGIASVGPKGPSLFGNGQIYLPIGGAAGVSFSSWLEGGNYAHYVADKTHDGSWDGTAGLKNEPLASMLDNFYNVMALNAMLGQFFAYMYGSQADAFLYALSHSHLSGEEIGQILGEADLFWVGPDAFAAFIMTLPLGEPCMADLIFALGLSFDDEEILLAALEDAGVPHEFMDGVRDQLDILDDQYAQQMQAQFDGTYHP